MDFDSVHKDWLDVHLGKRSGERRGRLERGHQHGEILYLRNVWYPVMGSLDNLHPEFEILDLRRRSFFTDFTYLPGHVKIVIEIKGYDAHVRDMDRNRYCDEINRETFLHGMGFRVICFAYDDVAHRPELCKTLLRVILSRYKPGIAPVDLMNRVEREIILLAFQLARPIRPKDIEIHLVLDHRTSVRCLQSLCQKGWFQPILCGKGLKVLQYELIRNSLEELEW